jgi:hypothetical protein
MNNGKSLKITTAILLPFFISFSLLATPRIVNNNPKSAYAVGISEKVTIDGKDSESFWELVPKAESFIQYSPFNGKAPSHNTEVRFAYDNHALYVFAQMYDNPDSTTYRLSKRDEANQADFFGIYIDPFNDGQGSYAFLVTVAGVQLDARNNGHEDYQWNAVWHSEVSMNDRGWTVEMAIPYSAIRFPKTDVQTWGLNITRLIQRTRERHYWNFVDINVPGLNKQMGKLLGIEKVVPPLRLSVSPYLSSYVDKKGNDTGYSLKGGVDLKYGINESFTLDMMLIPDFGQVASDREVLNLGPYETYFGENRDFFKEGMELFNRGGIFHSRRVGGRPDKYYNIALDSNQIVSENPATTQLINASKITGKTHKGFSLGFLNALSLPTYATIEDTMTGTKHRYETQSATNQNVTVIEQSLPYNSYVSLINTNVKREDAYYANATAVDMMFERGGYHAFAAHAAYTHRDISTNPDGHLFRLNWSKIRGKFRYSLTHRTESDTYNPNDMGFAYNNDKNIEQISVSYNNNTPSKRLLSWRLNTNYTYNTRYDFSQFKSMMFSMGGGGTFRNHFSFGVNSDIKPVPGYDYDEPRVAGFRYKTHGYYNGSFWISSDYRKPIAIDINAGAWQYINDNKSGYWYGISPRFLISDNLFIVYNFNQSEDFNSTGYVGRSSSLDSVFFGRRAYNKITNGLSTNYILNRNSSISMSLDHNWTRVKYFDYHLLDRNGNLTPLPQGFISRDNINRNFFNVDVAYVWQFAPGSELSVVWKNGLSTHSSDIDISFGDNINRMMKNEAQNTFSVRILYYLDYLYLKNKLL